MEKEGSQSNSGRWVQWKYKAANPPDDAISVGDITIKIMDAVKALYAKEGGAFPEPILNLKWDYKDRKGTFDALKVAKQINGYFLEDTVIEDKAKGTKTEFKKGDWFPPSACSQTTARPPAATGSWPAASMQKGENKMAKRGKEDPTGSWSVSQLVLCLAGQPADHLQPGLLRP